MSKLLMVVFALAWLMCGCAVETMLDDWRACVVAIVALLVCIVSAALITKGDE